MRPERRRGNAGWGSATPALPLNRAPYLTIVAIRAFTWMLFEHRPGFWP